MSDEEQIREMYRKYWDCMIRKDEAGLWSIMTEDYYLRHMTGMPIFFCGIIYFLLDYDVT